MLKSNKQEVDWADSDAKHILAECLEYGKILYLQQAKFAKFAKFPYKQFWDHLRHL
jgi:hypothetical protein